MKPRCLPTLALLCLLLPALSAVADPVSSTVTLRNIGITKPERLVGTEVSKEYFFPLPVRDFSAGSIEMRFVMKVSPFISPDSLVYVEIDGVESMWATLEPGRDGMVVVSKMPADWAQKPRVASTVRVAVRAVLNSTDVFNRCNQVNVNNIWIEIQPESALLATFDNRNPDWLSISRLPFTLRPEVAVRLPEKAASEQEDLALKVVSWLSFVMPAGDVTWGGIPRLDEVVIEDEGSGGPEVEVVPDGERRRIIVRASTADGCAKAWEALRMVQSIGLPGERWKEFRGGWPLAAGDPSRAIPVELLSPSFTALNMGIGSMSRGLRFDSALFGRGTADMNFRLKGIHKQVLRAGSATLRVVLNNQVVFTRDLGLETTEFDYNVPLPATLVRGDNQLDVVVHYIPSTEECEMPLFHFFWQVNPASGLVTVREPVAGKTADLVEAAQQFFGRGSYNVIVGDPAGLPATASAIAWLQKVNKTALLEPRLVSASRPEPGPVLAVGIGVEAAAAFGSSFQPPVSLSGEGLTFRSLARGDLFQAATASSVGIWQIAYRGPGAPVLLLDGWGPAGMKALNDMSWQIPFAPWFGTADVLMGDGSSPALAMSTSEVFQSSEPLGQPAGEQINWKAWRWPIVGVLWLLVSGVIFWIYSKSRENASRM